MMKFIKEKKWLGLIVILIIAGYFYFHTGSSKNAGEIVRFKPVSGTIKQIVSTTGVVEPQNRLEIKASVAGRIEKIFVDEGQAIKAGEVLALLSSTERSSLLDAAKLKDADTLAYWESVYNPIPLVSPIDGDVIAREFEPGQSVTPSDAILVLSDRLIVVAQVDETDIGYVKKGQRALIRLDAYPDIEVEGTVSHISFESLLMNNVTIYEVNILPDEIPDVFRSGMSANTDIIREEKGDVLLLPSYVIREEAGQKFVTVEEARGRKKSVQIAIGISDGDNTEIRSGLSSTDTVLWVQESRDSVLGRDKGANPFMPRRRN